MPTIQGQVASANTATTVLTVSAGTKVEVFQIELHSVHSGAQTVQVFFVPNSGGNVGTAGLTNEKESMSLAAGASISLVAPKSPWVMTGTNDTVQLKTTVAAVLNYWITYAVDGVL